MSKTMRWWRDRTVIDHMESIGTNGSRPMVPESALIAADVRADEAGKAVVVAKSLESARARSQAFEAEYRRPQRSTHTVAERLARCFEEDA